MAGKKKTITIPKVDIGNATLDYEAIPKSVLESLCRTIYRQTREYFKDPEVRADYEKWLVEYRKTHPVSQKAK